MMLTASAAQMVDSPGEVAAHLEFGGPTFTCCLTAPPEDKWAPIEKDFGEFVVRISDPQRFLSDFRAALSENDPWQHRAHVKWIPVECSKDELVPTRVADQRQTDVMRFAIS